MEDLENLDLEPMARSVGAAIAHRVHIAKHEAQEMAKLQAHLAADTAHDDASDVTQRVDDLVARVREGFQRIRVPSANSTSGVNAATGGAEMLTAGGSGEGLDWTPGANAILMQEKLIDGTGSGVHDRALRALWRPMLEAFGE